MITIFLHAGIEELIKFSGLLGLNKLKSLYITTLILATIEFILYMFLEPTLIMFGLRVIAFFAHFSFTILGYIIGKKMYSKILIATIFHTIYNICAINDILLIVLGFSLMGCMVIKDMHLYKDNY